MSIIMWNLRYEANLIFHATNFALDIVNIMKLKCVTGMLINFDSKSLFLLSLWQSMERHFEPAMRVIGKLTC